LDRKEKAKGSRREGEGEGKGRKRKGGKELEGRVGKESTGAPAFIFFPRAPSS